MNGSFCISSTSTSKGIFFFFTFPIWVPDVHYVQSLHLLSAIVLPTHKLCIVHEMRRRDKHGKMEDGVRATRAAQPSGGHKKNKKSTHAATAKVCWKSPRLRRRFRNYQLSGMNILDFRLPKVVVEEESDGTFIRSFANDKRWRVGSFCTTAVKDFPTHPSVGGGTFNIVIGKGEQTSDLRKVDVGALQANPLNKGKQDRSCFPHYPLRSNISSCVQLQLLRIYFEQGFCQDGDYKIR